MLQNQDKAFVFAIKRIVKDYDKKMFSIKNLHKGRYRLLEVDNDKYMLVYKREFFNTFRNKYPEIYRLYPYFVGKGESINKEMLDRAILEKVKFIYFIHPSVIYKINPELIKKFCEKFNLIRRQDKENVYHVNKKDMVFVQEITYSFPTDLMSID